MVSSYRGRQTAPTGVEEVASNAGSCAEEKAPEYPKPLLLAIRHGRKINSLCVSESGADRMLHVADTSKSLTCYRIP